MKAVVAFATLALCAALFTSALLTQSAAAHDGGSTCKDHKYRIYGEPGKTAHDRDNNGIGCESNPEPPGKPRVRPTATPVPTARPTSHWPKVPAPYAMLDQYLH